PTALEPSHLDHEEDHPGGYRDRRELPEHVHHVATVSKPPGGAGTRAVGARGPGRTVPPAHWRVAFQQRRGAPLVDHLPPQGSSMPIVVSNLVCWIALAGSTPLGQTAEHSPT